MSDNSINEQNREWAVGDDSVIEEQTLVGDESLQGSGEFIFKLRHHKTGDGDYWEAKFFGSDWQRGGTQGTAVVMAIEAFDHNRPYDFVLPVIRHLIDKVLS